MKIFTAEQMRELDRLTVERCGIPYATLMETAGSRVVEAIIEQYGSVEDKWCAVYCGRGNNGGDGAVIARLLWMRGAAKVRVYLFGRLAETKGEARFNFEIIRQMSAAEGQAKNDDELLFREIGEESDEDDYDAFAFDLVIDALLGTGLTRPAEGLYASAIEKINDLGDWDDTKVVAVDIPSGLSSDLDQPIGPHVQADLTVAFTGPKVGNVLSPACYANGKLVIATIGTPEWLFDEVRSALQLEDAERVAYCLADSRRAPTAHKNSVGDVLLIAGSRGKTGAAALASEAVLRAGAGLVTVATPLSAQALLVSQVRPEVMTEALDETAGGAIFDAAIERALELAAKRTVLAIGPGLSSSEESTRRFVLEVVRQRPCPVIVDADGLNALAPWVGEVRGSDELPIIVTPHPGEMARLTGKSTAEVVADRVNTAREFATSHHIITVLKGSRTLVAAPDGEVYVNPTGNAGMATAGSGDVLTGLIAGLLAQRPTDVLSAVIAGVYLHGLAGDLAASKLGLRSLIASDITNHISEAILRVGGAAEKP
jgi:ADP-dependent NAD(P)H-hydrate dehydratase / NAD(P)H-hydrate epimerase